jgi:hypothetical protein
MDPATDQATARRTHNKRKTVVIGPITAYLGGVDSHKNAEVRAVLAPLRDWRDCCGSNAKH